ncbi:FUSC family protein [Dictyobacter arantiisoli]|uniref:Membrane protein n=1 Tax=Dictyobacter arantiisoli TaxID=2014874 RepID=A0A5A5TKQ2_9CHLR|nr:FUSC family protein [Dictyobacter arantiisoli]GCF11494.1 membrane protein [Dictyobacter arantiisoli]
MKKKHTPGEQLKHYLRRFFSLSLQVPRSDLLYGLRIALIVAAPLFIAPLLGESRFAAIIMFGGMYTALSGIGGTYRTQATTMGQAVIFYLIGALVAFFASQFAWLAILVAFLWCCFFSMLSIYGSSYARIGAMSINVFALLLSEPAANIDATFLTMLALAIGGIWSIVVSLWLWPIRPYQPETQVVTDYYRTLATFTRNLFQFNHSTMKKTRGQIWEKRNNAHSMVISAHANDEETTAEIRRLSLLTLHADRFFHTALSLTKTLEHATQVGLSTQTQQIVEHGLQQIAIVLDQITQATRQNKRTIKRTVLDQVVVELTGREQALQELYNREMVQAEHYHHTATPAILHKISLQRFPQPKEYRAISHALHLLHIFQELIHTLMIMIDTINQADEEHLHGFQVSAIRKAYRQKRSHFLKDWFNTLTWKSPTFRHAVRFGLAMAIGVAIYKLFGIEHGFWISLTITICLKSQFSTTIKKGFERVGFTLFGALLAALAVAFIRVPFDMLVLIVLCSVFAFTYYQHRYKIYVIFITPFSLLLNSLDTPGHWSIALLRFGNTLIGGVLALLIGYLLWPQWESERLPKQLAKAIETNRQFLRSVLAVYFNQPWQPHLVRQQAQKAQLANNDVAAAYQRLLAEPKRKRGNAEQWETLILNSQQLWDCINALSTHSTLLDKQNQLPHLVSFTRSADAMLTQLEGLARGAEQQNASSLPIQQFSENLQQLQALQQRLLAYNPVSYRTADLPIKKQALKDVVPAITVLDQIAQYVAGMYQTLSPR